MLILDEPTAGLDPKQIIETRDLIHSLAGDHTIILSTHILSEVEHSCERVIIIAKGKLVATDSVANLTSRLRGSETVAVEVESNGGRSATGRRAAAPGTGGRASAAWSPRSPGTAATRSKSKACKAARSGRNWRRRSSASGWSLTELRAVGLSLEEIFLQLTAAKPDKKDDKGGRRRPIAGNRGVEMRNTLIICRKELKGYFASPIAYLLMAFFALIFGFFFYSATRFPGGPGLAAPR